MRMFSSATFRKSPLSISVPLDGTDTVPGLTKLLQRRRVDALEDRLGLPRGKASCCRVCGYLTGSSCVRVILMPRRDGVGGSQSTRRYKGPYVSELSMDSLTQAPKPWPTFFMGDTGGASRGAYSLPADTTMLLDRLEENLVFFLVRKGHIPRACAGYPERLWPQHSPPSASAFLHTPFFGMPNSVVCCVSGELLDHRCCFWASHNVRSSAERQLSHVHCPANAVQNALWSKDHTRLCSVKASHVQWYGV